MIKNTFSLFFTILTACLLNACDSQYTQFEIFPIDSGRSHLTGSSADSLPVKHFLLDGHIDLPDSVEVRKKILAYISGNEKETLTKNKTVELIFYISQTGFNKDAKETHKDLSKVHDPYVSLIYRKGNLYSSAFYDGKKMLGVSYEMFK
ncbi:hypothetical protein [Sediminibacterium sp.]|uniref:hypothetical protein n=1 Tax=Sediminibacterium sp. TaxID=1917865 RepID=UPI0027303373|nr:hypothetical protein [Sediminibacterium sp.]MDP2421424.1 hypothetical protein [Sediminibacterium sp.]